MQSNNVRKNLDCMANPSKLLSLSPSTRANVLKSLICLSKYLGNYLQFKEKLKQYGIRWIRPDSFDSFIRIMNNNHSDLMEWYRNVYSILGDNEKLYLRFMLLSGLRKTEGIMSFNLIIDLFKDGKISDYFNEDLSMLEHYKHRQFLRNTKNVYITIIPKDFVMQIASSRPVSYNAIHCYLYKKHIKLRLKELRSFYASFMVRHNIISEEVDLLQGRVSKSIFVRHYLKENPVELRDRIFKALTELEQSI
jgi:intergrase/recombinase